MKRPLEFDVLVSDATTVSQPDSPDGLATTWPPTSHTLIYGTETALLVDPPATGAQTDTLATWIEQHDQRLGYIYITHPHGDHWFGTSQLLGRFPGVSVLSGAGAAARITRGQKDGSIERRYRTYFGDQLPDVSSPFTVQAMPSQGLAIDGHLLFATEVGHSDTDDSTVLHAPDLNLVVAGDVVYNNVHLSFGEASNGGVEAWKRALDLVAALKPRTVIAGHTDVHQPNGPEHIEHTRDYLDRVGPLLDTATNRHDFYKKSLNLFPDRVNPFTAWLNAVRLFQDG